jgi:hypothetical protein
MKLWGNAVASVLLVVGVIWILQGANILGGSFMTGQSLWLYIGIVVTIFGIAAFWWANSY